MARKTETRSIDGLTFTVQMLPGMAGSVMFPRLCRILGPAMLKAFSGTAGSAAVGKLSLSNLDIGGLSEAAQMLFDRLTPEEYESLIRAFLENALVQVDGKTLSLMATFDDVMAGRAGTVIKLMVFALELNFRDFWPALLANAARLGAPEVQASQSKA